VVGQTIYECGQQLAAKSNRTIAPNFLETLKQLQNAGNQASH
jgi:hypothetical protein